MFSSNSEADATELLENIENNNLLKCSLSITEICVYMNVISILSK